MSELSIEIDDHLRKALEACRKTGMTRAEAVGHVLDRTLETVREVYA